MLQDKYLPAFDFTKTESITISKSAREIYPLICDLDFSSSRMLYWLFKIRGIPVPRSLSLKGLESINFIRLEEEKNKELIIGIIGKFWSVKGNLQKFQPQDFLRLPYPLHAKATWNFELEEISPNQTRVITETRIHCPTAKTKRMFSLYWFIIKPFSALVRLKFLQCLKKQAEADIKTSS
ncbi:MAG TPA: hypothetical protein VGD17_19660 [Chitinophagaceae bacterium]